MGVRPPVPRKPKGGARRGAGRPKGSKNQATQLLESIVADIRAGRTGASPLEIMASVAATLWRMADQTLAGGKDQHRYTTSGEKVPYTAVELMILASEAAARVAPYIHPRLTSIQGNANGAPIQIVLSEADAAL